MWLKRLVPGQFVMYPIAFHNTGMNGHSMGEKIEGNNLTNNSVNTYFFNQKIFSLPVCPGIY
jgi:hypothetical protein